MNDTQTLSLEDDYATIDEVNEVLTNNYVQKNELNNYYDKQYIRNNYPDFDNLAMLLDTYTYSKNDLEEGLYWRNQVDYKLALNTSIPDMTNYVLKTDYEELKEKIAILETAIKPSYPWLSYYQGFEEIEYYGDDHISAFICFSYNVTTKEFRIVHTSMIANCEYLCVLHVPGGGPYYFRFDNKQENVYENEIFGASVSASCKSDYTVFSGLPLTNFYPTSPQELLKLDHVFKKPSVE